MARKHYNIRNMEPVDRFRSETTALFFGIFFIALLAGAIITVLLIGFRVIV